MNRKALLKWARAQTPAYEGPEDLDKLKSWATENLFEVTDGDGNGIDSIWANVPKAKKVVLNDPDPADDDADGDDGICRKANPVQQVNSSMAMSPSGTRSAWEAKAYNRKANMGQTVFCDYDKTEYFGAWLRQALAAKGDPRFKDAGIRRRDTEILGKASSTIVNTDGGALIPQILLPELIDLKERYGAARTVVGVTPMSTSPTDIKRRTDGFTGYWTGENQALTSEDMKFDNPGLSANKLTVLSVHSAEMILDSRGEMADIVAGEIMQTFSFKEDEAYFNGDGTSTYGGFQGAAHKLYNVSATKANIAGLVAEANSWAGQTLAHHQQVLSVLPDYADTARCTWLMSRAYFFQVCDRLVRAAGGITDTMIRDVRVPAGIAASGRNFLGYPVVFAQVMPRSTAVLQVNALFGDFSLGSKFGEITGSMEIASSDQRYFDTDQVAIRGKERVGVLVHDVGNASATPAARVAGPICGIATTS